MSYLGRSAKLSLKAQEKVSFLATAGQTEKTGLSYTPTFVEVYVNGVLLTDTTDFTATNGNSITFTVALLLNDEVTVISLKTFTVADHYTKSDADTLLAAKATNTAVALKAPVASPVFTGNVGIGVTPEAWSGTVYALQLGEDTALYNDSAHTILANNAYLSGGNKYLSTGGASRHYQVSGTHRFEVAPSGTADAAISFTTAMTIGNTGIVTMPNQPSFLVGCSSQSQTTGGHHKLTMMTIERFDTASNYANAEFTAPVTGRYQFNWTIRVDVLSHTSAHCSVDLSTSNRNYNYATINDMRSLDQAPDYWSFCGSQLVDMDAGDIAYLTSYFNGTTGTIEGASTWSGYLVA